MRNPIKSLRARLTDPYEIKCLDKIETMISDRDVQIEKLMRGGRDILRDIVVMKSWQDQIGAEIDGFLAEIKQVKGGV